MTRGRHPVRALEEAETIAKKRGLVRYYERGPGLTCNFSIVNPEILAQVRIMRMRYLRCTLQWLEREALEEIAGLKMFPSSREISRELWICSPEYCWRFFRVCDTGLIELGLDGAVLPPKSPVPLPGMKRPDTPLSVVSPSPSVVSFSPDTPLNEPFGDTKSPSKSSLTVSTTPAREPLL
jgi:hypothetical protein